LFEEPMNLLRQELKMPETYSAIITAIAGGCSRLHEIASKAGIETSQCSKMLSTLMSLGLVRKEYPITYPKSNKSIYRLGDWMFVFWRRFVLPDISRITAGLGEIVCGEVFAEQLNSHMGHAFEECAIQYMWRMLKEKKLPIPFRRIGRWWGSNPKEHREEEIDFVAYAGEKAIFGECKWRNKQVGEDTLEDLMRKSALLPSFTNVHYMLFSKSGFTDALINRSAKQNGITLIAIEDMFLRATHEM
jgi:AAA+ ATPase superfamily predicted ATPase